MRILHLATGNLYGGIESFLLNLVSPELSDQSLEHHFILSHSGRLAEELRVAHHPAWVVPGARLRKPWAIRRVRAAARGIATRIRPDVVLAHGPWAYFVLGHGVRDLPAPLGLFQHGLASTDLLHRLALRRLPVFVLANSSATASSIGKSFGGCPVRVCACPVPPPRSTTPRHETRERLGAGQDDVVVVQTSRLEPWKGQSLLLEALSQLRGLPWKLWFAGGSSRPSERRLRDRLEGLARSRDVASRVTFLGERRDIGDILHAADIFCQANLEREPYGVALVEAMSHGLPVVTTEMGATAAGIGAETGRIVRAEADELGHALRELIVSADTRRSLGEASRARYLEHHSVPEAVAHLRATLEEFTAGPGAIPGVAAWA